MTPQSVAQKVRQLQLKTRKILSSTMVGDRSTANKGAGFEFDQMREYQQGDDVRFIDWKSTAKAGKFLTRQYFEERNHNLVIALDISQSSFVGHGQQGKFGFMSELAAIFALVAEYGKDRVGLVLFSDQINLHLPMAGGGQHTFRILESIFAHQPSNKPAKTDLGQLFRHLRGHLKSKSLVLVISDFITGGDFQRDLKILQCRHEVVAVRCLDQLEQVFPEAGIFPVLDPETGAVTTIDTRRAQVDRLNEQLAKRIIEQNLLLRRSGADLLQIHDAGQMIPEVIKFFRKRLAY